MSQEKVYRGSKARFGLLFVLLAGGAGLLGLCCLGVGGGLYFWATTQDDPEKLIVGRWQVPNFPEGPLTTLEFKENGDYQYGKLGRGTWKTISKQGNTITVEVAYGDPAIPKAQPITFNHYFVFRNRNAMTRSDFPGIEGNLVYNRN